MTVCSVAYCGRRAKARGWCKRHWQNWRRNGYPEPIPIPHLVRFWSNVDRLGAGPDECWPWLGTIGVKGYGIFKADGQPVGAHRVAYELAHGPVPDGLQVGHRCHDLDLTCPGGCVCRHRRCVNPAHLAAMTIAENIGASGRGIRPVPALDSAMSPPGGVTLYPSPGAGGAS